MNRDTTNAVPDDGTRIESVRGGGELPRSQPLNQIQLASAFAALNTALRCFRCSLDALLAPMGVVLRLARPENDRIPAGVLLRYAELEVAEAFALPPSWLGQLASLFPGDISEADYVTWRGLVLEGSNITLRACSNEEFAELRTEVIVVGRFRDPVLEFSEDELGGSHWSVRKFKSVGDLRSAYPNLPESAGIAHHSEHLLEGF